MVDTRRMDRLKDRYVAIGSGTLDVLVMGIGLIILVLFGISLLDLILQIIEMTQSGNIYEPLAVLGMVDTVILLLIMVEVFRDIIAYLNDLAILPIIIDIAILAVARNIITFRFGESISGTEALIQAGAYSILLVALVIVYYVVKIMEPREELQDETEQTI